MIFLKKCCCQRAVFQDELTCAFLLLCALYSHWILVLWGDLTPAGPPEDDGYPYATHTQACWSEVIHAQPMGLGRGPLATV